MRRSRPRQAIFLVPIAILWVWPEDVGIPKSSADVPSAAPNSPVRIDVSAWLAFYQKADARGRDALLKCWYSQERSYVEILRKCHPKDQARAEELLADLWRRNLLPTADRLAIISTLVALRIIELEATQGRRELEIQAERRFPFPKGTQLEWGYDIAIGLRPLQINSTFGNSRDWEGAGTFSLGSFGGSGYFGTPSAQAVISIREKVDGQVLWQYSWKVGPTRLKFAQPDK